MELSYEEYSELMDQLVAEGYDVLEASKMIFGYLNEMGTPGGNRPGQQSTTRGAVTMYAQPRPNTRQPYQSRFRRQSDIDRSWQSEVSSNRTNTSRAMVGNLGANYRGQELQAGARASASQVGTPRQGSAGTGAAPSASARPTPNVVRTSTPVARPTAATPTSRPTPRVVQTSTPVARPTATSPTTPPAADANVKVAPTSTSAPTTPPATSTAAPSRPSLSSGIEDIRRMQQASQMRQKGITITSDQIKAAQRTRPTSDTIAQAASKPVAFNPSSSPAVDTSKAYTTPAPAGGYGGVQFKPQTSFSLSKPAETKKNQQKINAGMEIKGNELQEQLKPDSYGSYARPDSLFEAYQSIYNQ